MKMLKMWDVELTCKETIKPLSATPPHPPTYNLSWLDLIIHGDHIAFVLFHPNPNPNSLSTLKTSLSQTLTTFYPLAGRLNHDSTSIDCNDDGILLFEARATADAPLSRLVSDRDVVDSVDSLLPCSQSCSKKYSYGDPLLCIQITTFSLCGGIAVGCCFSHKIADGHSAAMFIDTWAATACGHACRTVPVFDAASYFAPPTDDKGSDELNALIWIPPDHVEERLITKMFLFKDSTAIRSLRESSPVSGLTRVQAVTALVWRCCMRAKVISDKQQPNSAAIALVMVNMRGSGRGLPESLFGNLGFMVAAWDRYDDDGGDRKWRTEEKVNAAIKAIDEEKLTRYQARDGWSSILENVSDAVKQVEDETGIGPDGMYFFSSWTRFAPLYEADFGWGKPIWVAAGGPFMRYEFVLTASGGGIEAWVTLEEEEMMRFECDEEINKYL